MIQPSRCCRGHTKKQTVKRGPSHAVLKFDEALAGAEVGRREDGVCKSVMASLGVVALRSISVRN